MHRPSRSRVAVVFLALLTLALTWATSSPASDTKTSYGVADRVTAGAKSQRGDARREAKGIRYDYRGRSLLSYVHLSQWKWPENPLVGTLTYCIQNGTADITGTEENKAIKTAFGIWDAAAARVEFKESCPTATILVSWGEGEHGDGFPFDGENKTLAHAFLPHQKFDGDIHFDDAEKWTLEERATSAQPIDLVTVAAHEIGHSLGFDHSADKTALMWETYTQSHRFLGADDKKALEDLYTVIDD